MTNFSGEIHQGRLKWLSPERAVLVLPLLAGLGLALLILPAGVWPILERVNSQQEEVDQLRTKSMAVPQLRQQLAELSMRQRLREQQLDRLLALVAGTSELNTFLAELNDIANASRVVITTTEPGDVERFISQSAASDEAAPPAAGGEDPSAPSTDALLNKGLEKRSAGLTVQGEFLQVYGFLRALERLQVFVIISEMNIKADAQTRGEDDAVGSPEITMSLKLTAYGRQMDAVQSVDQETPIDVSDRAVVQSLYSS